MTSKTLTIKINLKKNLRDSSLATHFTQWMSLMNLIISRMNVQEERKEKRRFELKSYLASFINVYIQKM
jgi:hypothetical protein